MLLRFQTGIVTQRSLIGLKAALLTNTPRSPSSALTSPAPAICHADHDYHLSVLSRWRTCSTYRVSKASLIGLTARSLTSSSAWSSWGASAASSLAPTVASTSTVPVLSPVISVAPMVDVTGRHFRYLLRIMSKRATLWTPMFAARKLANCKRHEAERLLRYHPDEGPPVVQLGGDDPRTMLAAARRCQALGYSEVNINLGCPARSAQAGNHGAALMRPPHGRLVALMRTMTEELSVPVSAKVRIGVDEYDSYDFVRDFVQQLQEDGGCRRFVIHARKVLLGGLPREATEVIRNGVEGSFVTTRQNRLDELVPLRWDWVHRLKKEMNEGGGGVLERMEINGGVKDMGAIRMHLAAGMDGVMMGRLARDDPFFFAAVDSKIFGEKDAFAGLCPLQARCKVLSQYAEYALSEQREGHESSREMLIQPMNSMFEGGELVREKKAFAEAVRRGAGGKRSALVGEDIMAAVEMLLSGGATDGAAAGGGDRRAGANNRGRQGKVGLSPRRQGTGVGSKSRRRHDIPKHHLSDGNKSSRALERVTRKRENSRGLTRPGEMKGDGAVTSGEVMHRRRM